MQHSYGGRRLWMQALCYFLCKHRCKCANCRCWYWYEAELLLQPPEPPSNCAVSGVQVWWKKNRKNHHHINQEQSSRTLCNVITEGFSRVIWFMKHHANNKHFGYYTPSFYLITQGFFLCLLWGFRSVILFFKRSTLVSVISPYSVLLAVSGGIFQNRPIMDHKAPS